MYFITFVTAAAAVLDAVSFRPAALRNTLTDFTLQTAINVVARSRQMKQLEKSLDSHRVCVQARDLLRGVCMAQEAGCLDPDTKHDH